MLEMSGISELVIYPEEVFILSWGKSLQKVYLLYWIILHDIQLQAFWLLIHFLSLLRNKNNPLFLFSWLGSC